MAEKDKGFLGVAKTEGEHRIEEENLRIAEILDKNPQAKAAAERAKGEGGKGKK